MYSLFVPVIFSQPKSYFSLAKSFTVACAALAI
jgi:hypothetical protein